MKNYKLIFGGDILEELTINNKELRLQLERELKGKLLHLRESFFESADDKRKLSILFSVSLRAFLSLFPVILHLKNVELPGAGEELFHKTVEELSLDKELLTKLWKIKEGSVKFSRTEGIDIWGKYVEEIRKIAFEIDKLRI